MPLEVDMKNQSVVPGGQNIKVKLIKSPVNMGQPLGRPLKRRYILLNGNNYPWSVGGQEY